MHNYLINYLRSFVQNGTQKYQKTNGFSVKHNAVSRVLKIIENYWESNETHRKSLGIYWKSNKFIGNPLKS